MHTMKRNVPRRDGIRSCFSHQDRLSGETDAVQLSSIARWTVSVKASCVCVWLRRPHLCKTDLCKSAGWHREARDASPRTHASFAVSDAMVKTTHHGSEPIEGRWRTGPWREAVDWRAAVLARRGLDRKNGLLPGLRLSWHWASVLTAPLIIGHACHVISLQSQRRVCLQGMLPRASPFYLAAAQASRARRKLS